MAGYRKLGRTSSQRKALIRSQVTSLLYHGKIRTTEARAKEIRKVAEGLIAMAVREKDNFETVTVTAKVPRKDKDGKRVKEEKNGRKVTVYDEVQKEIKKDKPSRLHARRQMLKVLYDVTEVPVSPAGRKKNTKSVDLPAKLFDEIAPKYVSRNGGYTRIVEKMLDGIEVITGVSYQEYIESSPMGGKTIFTDRQGNTFDKVLYTGMLDEFFQFQLGHLEYRALRFEQEELPECENYQGNAVVNYTDRETAYTRIIEHKHFEFGKQPGTVITREYPTEWKPGEEPCYPVNNEKNNALFAAYRKLAETQPQVLFGGRLGAYQYYDMDKVIAAALEMVKKEAARAN